MRTLLGCGKGSLRSRICVLIVEPPDLRLPRRRAADFPCYVFERGCDDESAALMEDYTAPDIFSDDVYDLDPELRSV